MSEPPLARPTAVPKCSFCGKSHNEVAKVVAGPNDVAICDECVDVCRDIIGDQRAASSPPSDAVPADDYAKLPAEERTVRQAFDEGWRQFAESGAKRKPAQKAPSAIAIEVCRVVTDELRDAMARLVPQLSSSATIPSEVELRDIVTADSTCLLAARDGGRIVGTLTLVIFRIPTGVRAWIEDVAVDAGARGRGVGETLSREAIRIAASRGARTVELTSRPSRDAANRLYRRIGFEPRGTNVYRYTIRDS